MTFWLGPSGRLAHHAGYVRDLAVNNEFAIKQMQEIRLRLESRRPVLSWLVVLQ